MSSGDLAELRAELAPRFRELFAVRFRAGDADGEMRAAELEHERCALLAAWEEWREQPSGRVADGHELEARRCALGRAAGGGPAVATGSKWLRFVTPSDVRALKTRIDAHVAAVDADVTSSTSIDESVRAAWAAWRGQWMRFRDEPDSWLHTAAQYDQAENEQDELHGWEQRLGDRGVKLSAPPIESVDRAGVDAGLLKTGLVVAGLVAGVVLVRTMAGK